MPRLTNPKQTILTCAYRLFHRLGFNRVSMDEIATAAGVTKRTLYFHFRSKDDLMAAALESQHELALVAFRTWTDRISRKPEAIVVSLFDELQKWASQRHFFAWDLRVSQSNWPKCLATPHEQSRAGTAANQK